MDCNLLGFSVCGIFQAKLLEWAAISFSRGFVPPRDWTNVSSIAGGFFTVKPPGKVVVFFTLSLLRELAGSHVLGTWDIKLGDISGWTLPLIMTVKEHHGLKGEVSVWRAKLCEGAVSRS